MTFGSITFLSPRRDSKNNMVNIMANGSFIKMGNKLGSTFPETGDGLYDLIDAFYQGAYSFGKSAGAATYGDNGYFNSIMGKEITAAMFACDNVFTAIGARAYQHEGVRIATEQASYGLVTSGDAVSNLSVGDFGGLGAGTIQDGSVPASVKMPVNEFREPYKDLPFAFDYGLGLQALENKDDTIAYRDYIDKMSTNYSNLADQTILRPVYMKQPVKDGVETSLNSISRCISSYGEIGKVEGGVTLTGDYVSPYGGFTSAKGDFYSFRSAGASNLDGQLVDTAGQALSIPNMRKLWRQCSVNWKDSASPNNKMFAMSNVAQDKLGALMLANNVYLDSVYVQRDFNGVKTIPGRDAGILLQSFQNVPIIQDGNMNFDFTTKKVSTTKMGEIDLLDLDHIWLSMLTPLEMYNVNNPAITRILQEVNVMNMRAETRTDSYIQSGKIINLPDDS